MSYSLNEEEQQPRENSNIGGYHRDKRTPFDRLLTRKPFNQLQTLQNDHKPARDGTEKGNEDQFESENPVNLNTSDEKNDIIPSNDENEFANITFNTTTQIIFEEFEEFQQFQQFQQFTNIPSIAVCNEKCTIVKMLQPLNASILDNSVGINEQTCDGNNLDRNTDSRTSGLSLCNYLNCKQNCSRKVTPILEDADYVENKSNPSEPNPKSITFNFLNMKSCWPKKQLTEDVEIYYTHSTIKHRPSQTHKKQLPPNLETIQMKHQEVQTVSGTLLKSSQSENIHLQHYGNIMTCNDDGITDEWLKYDTDPSTLKTQKSSKLQHFYWLLRPFRGKYRKPKRTEKIHGVVYKTYFLKWTKPPHCLTNGYGIKRYPSELLLSSSIRRCRSATF